MDWTELTLAVKAEDTGPACDIVALVSPDGFYLEDYSDLEAGAREIAHIDLIDETLLHKDRGTSLLHIYISPDQSPDESVQSLTALLDSAGIEHRLDQGNIREEDWANNWKRYFHTQPVGKRLLILPSWETAESQEGRRILKIDPGAAFGTGTHATTRLCLETMEETVRPGISVLDLGCGSGILSIASMLLGASTVTGVDIDPLAVRTAEENGRKNGLERPAYTMLSGDLTDCVTGRFDLITANIVADVIIRLCRKAAEYLNPGGRFIASGIIESREPEVLTALAGAGLSVTTRKEREGWLCFACSRLS